MTSEEPRAGIFTSWKEIANYFGKGVRTVQRWEQQMGLPILRPNDEDNKVVAYVGDLDDWLAKKWSRRKAGQAPVNLETSNAAAEPVNFFADIGTAQLAFTGSQSVKLQLQRCAELRQMNHLLREEVRALILELSSRCDTLRRFKSVPQIEGMALRVTSADTQHERNHHENEAAGLSKSA